MQDIDEWIRVFNESRSSGEGQQNAIQKLYSFSIERPLDFITVLAYFLTTDDIKVEHEIKNYSLILLSRVLRPGSPAILEELRHIWSNTANENVINSIKDVIFRSLVSNDATTQNVAALCNALVFGLNPQEWAPSIFQVLDAISTSEAPISARIGGLSIYVEILQLPYFTRDLANDNFNEIYRRFFIVALNIIGNQGSGPNIEDEIKLRREAATAVTKSIQVYPNLTSDPEAVRMILDNLPPSLQIDSSPLFYDLHAIMLEVLKAYYAHNGEFVEKIFDYVSGGLKSTTIYVQNTALTFWRELAVFESEVQKADELLKSKSQQNYQKIVESAAPSIIPIIVDILSQINPEDLKVEDPNDQLPSMFATVALAAIFAVAPDVILPLISTKFDEMVSSSDWRLNHASILVFYCTVEQSHPDHPDVAAFVSSSISKVQEFISSKNDRLKETALWAMSYAILSVPILITQAADPVSIIKSLLDSFVIEKETHFMILVRYASIIYAICSALKPTTTFHPFSSLFDQILFILNKLLEHEERLRHCELIQVTYEAFAQFVEVSPAKCINQLEDLWEPLVDQIQQSAGSIQQNEILFSIHQGQCYLLLTLAKRIRKIPKEQGMHALHVLYDLISKEQTMAYEEATYALAIIAIFIEEQPLEDSALQTILTFYDQILKSNDVHAIPASAAVVRLWFQNMGNYIQGVANPFFNDFMDILASENVRRDVYPPLIGATAAIITSQSKEDECFEDNVEKFHAMLMKFIDCPIDNSVQADLDFASDLYGAIAIGMKAFASIRYTPDLEVEVERRYLDEMVKLSQMVMRVVAMTEDSLQALLEMYEQYSTHCSRKNNIILNKNINVKVIELAKAKPKLKDKATAVHKYMRSK